MTLGNALQKLLFKKCFDIVTGLACFLRAYFQQMGIAKLSLGMIVLGLWNLLQSLKPCHHEQLWAWCWKGLRVSAIKTGQDAAESYRFGGGPIVLRCSVHVRNHFRPTKLIIACFDHGSCIDHIWSYHMTSYSLGDFCPVPSASPKCSESFPSRVTKSRLSPISRPLELHLKWTPRSPSILDARWNMY